MRLREVFAKNLKRIREEQGLSQEKLAEMADLHRTYIGMIERKRINVTLDVIDRISQALSVDPFDLLARELKK